MNKIILFLFLILDLSHHPASTSAVSLVVSVPLSTTATVNLPSNTNALHHQIPTIKSFANVELSTVRYSLILFFFLSL